MRSRAAADLLGITSVHVNPILRQLPSARPIVRHQYVYTYDLESRRQHPSGNVEILTVSIKN